VKLRTGRTIRLAIPFRVLTQRFALLFLIVAGIGLMLAGRNDTALVEQLRSAAVDTVAPIMDALSRPAATVAEGVANARELINLRSENTRLARQIEGLVAWRATAQRLSQENALLEALLNHVPDPGMDFVTARVIADSGGVFVRALLVNAGAQQGVIRGNAVLSGNGLAGRITGVGDRASRVLLITDLNSRIPVLIESTRDRAILAGDNSAKPRLVFLPPNASIQPGDRVVTSGHGGLFPPGIPVGIVEAAEPGDVRVRPFVDLDRLEHVRILGFRRADRLAGEPASEDAK
jgi:rod shape-determining protein MreC